MVSKYNRCQWSWAVCCISAGVTCVVSSMQCVLLFFPFLYCRDFQGVATFPFITRLGLLLCATAPNNLPPCKYSTHSSCRGRTARHVAWVSTSVFYWRNRKCSYNWVKYFLGLFVCLFVSSFYSRFLLAALVGCLLALTAEARVG